MARRRREIRGKSAKALRRREGTRDIPDRVLIVSEGSKTEPGYFRALINELGLTTAQVRITGESGSAPMSVVEYGEAILGKDPEFEQAYFVFDRDRHVSYDDALIRIASLRAEKRGVTRVHPVTSVPSFEIWLLMHVSSSRKPYESAGAGGSPCDALIRDLRKAEPFTNYDKASCDYFAEIAPLRPKAIAAAKASLQQARNEGQKGHHENPSTRVHRVVEALEALRDKTKK